MSVSRAVALRVARVPVVAAVALRAAALRRRSLVLVYHRVAPDGAKPHEIVRSLPASLFSEQVAALKTLGDLVPLEALLDPSPVARRRFAVTFDDDDVAHVQHALPVLRQHGIAACFFLAGRALNGLGPYWWQLVEESVRLHGLGWTRDRLTRAGLSIPSDGLATLTAALEASPYVDRLEEILSPVPSPTMLDESGIRALAEAGMTIGFHTLRHPRLPSLDDASLDAAVTEGRATLATVIGRPVTLLAYPYGRTDARVARAAARAGYVAAFATGGRPLDDHADRFRLGRWDPGTLRPSELRAAVAVYISRSPLTR